MLGCSNDGGKLRLQMESGAIVFGAVAAHVRILYFILNVMDFERTLEAFEQGK